MQSYLVTLVSGRMLLVEAEDRAAANRAVMALAERQGWSAPHVKHVSELSADTAAILRRNNPERVYDPLDPRCTTCGRRDHFPGTVQGHLYTA